MHICTYLFKIMFNDNMCMLYMYDYKTTLNYFDPNEYVAILISSGISVLVLV